MAKKISEFDKDIKRMNQQSRRNLNEVISEYVSIYNRLEADAVDPVLHDQQIEDMEERMAMIEKWFVGMFLGSQGYSLHYDENKCINQYQKTGRAKEF